MSDPSNGPMRGVKILDLGSMIAGPAAASILADQGADVIKIEPPGIGDVMRYLGASSGGMSGLFHNSNRGKRSLALNLKSEEGMDIVRRLASEVDVVVHNFRKGVAERLGFDYDSLKACNPDLIYLWVSGFGPEGPMARHAAYDNVIQAFSGVAHSQADLVTGEPTQYFQLFSDKLTALTGAQAIASALFAREREQGGQLINLSMVDSVVSFLWADVAGASTFLDEGAVQGMNVSRTTLMPLADGWAAMAPVTDTQFHGVCKALGVDSSRPELATAIDRNANPGILNETYLKLREVAAQMAVDDVIALLTEADVPCAKAMKLSELPTHPQMQANGSFVETQHPRAGRIVEPRNPPRFQGTPSGTGSPSAALGQHTDDILDELGFSAKDIAGLRADGVVG